MQWHSQRRSPVRMLQAHVTAALTDDLPATTSERSD
jgi:hypothetical protein